MGDLNHELVLKGPLLGTAVKHGFSQQIADPLHIEFYQAGDRQTLIHLISVNSQKLIEKPPPCKS